MLDGICDRYWEFLINLPRENKVNKDIIASLENPMQIGITQWKINPIIF